MVKSIVLVKSIMFALVAVCIITTLPISVSAQYTQDVQIILTSEIFHYGDKLDYTIIVSDITGEDARIYITDTTGKRSPLYSMPISEKETRVIAPIGFDSIIWSEGKYSLELDYSGAIDKTDFTIIDDGSVGIPYWVNDLAKLWITTQIPDKEYAKAIQYLIEQEILERPESDGELYIPQWFRYPTVWWSSGQITDTTYTHTIQFLIDNKFMTIPFDQESSVPSSESFL